MTQRVFALALALVVLIQFASCGGAKPAPTEAGPSFFNSEDKKICLVLSVGGLKGIAHLGAIQALKDLGYQIDCVVGNSIGALIGSLYATNPVADTTGRFEKLITKYTEETKQEAKRSASTGAILGGLLVFLTGGAAAPVLAGAAGGTLVGIGNFDKVNLERLVRVMNSFYGGTRVESLPITFRTYYKETSEDKLGLVTVQHGNLAEAVGKSIANPLIFKEHDAAKTGYVDPGVDRISAIPINDACDLFSHHRILAINITNDNAYDYSNIQCPVFEIKILLEPVDNEAVLTFGPEFRQLIKTGYESTLMALHKKVRE